MKKKILIVGKNSFIANIIFSKLKKNQNVTKIGFPDLKKKKKNYFNKFQIIINCSINTKYINNKYCSKNDIDFYLAKKIKFTNCNYIFLSSRKVYYPKYNITEKSRTNPVCFYGKNKLITENKLKCILKNKLLILRISNIIGFKKKNYKKAHETFVDFFRKNIMYNNILTHRNIFKDFLSANQFSNIIQTLISKNVTGTLNVSIGKKIFLNDIVNWLNHYNKNKINYIPVDRTMNNDSFTLNNAKLKKICYTDLTISKLKKDCLKLSKKIFKKK